MGFEDIRNKIKSLQSFDIVSETIDIINKNSFFISGLLRLQLQEGKDGDGKLVTIFGRDFYKDATVFEKERHGVGFGKFTDWVTNYMSGDFYNSLKVRTDGVTFESYSTVPYFDEILLRSGDVIMELNQEHLLQLSEEIIIPQLQERLRKYGL